MDGPDILTWQIVKWVLIVLVAAFIGQFGKTFAQYLMHRFRPGKTEAQPSVTESSALADAALRTNAGSSEASLKTQKKEDKVLLKAKKKDKKNK